MDGITWPGISIHAESLTRWFFKAGLIVPRKKGEGHYDRFRNRIIFPIFQRAESAGGVWWPGDGRRLAQIPEQSGNAGIQQKPVPLRGTPGPPAECREIADGVCGRRVFRSLSMHQFGIENTVATLGTSLTADHVRILKGFVGEGGRAILVYDSDQAGIKAAQRSVSVFQKGLLEARILVLPKGHDPDSFLMAFGPDDFMKAAEQAMGMIPFMVESAVDKYGLSIDGKVRIVNDLKSAILAIADPVARSLRVKQLAERIGVDESAIILQKVRHAAPAPARAPGFLVDQKPVETNTGEPVRGETYRLERQMVTMMLQFPEMIADIERRRTHGSFYGPRTGGDREGNHRPFCQNGRM